VIISLRNSWMTRLVAGLISCSMFSLFLLGAVPVRADDVTAPATTTPPPTDAGNTGTTATSETPATASSTPAIAVPMSSINTILLLPAINNAGPAYGSGASALGSAVKLKMNAVGRFLVTAYAPYMPAIQRALNVEDTLSREELTPPFNDPVRARKIASIVGTDGFALISYDSETIDPASNSIKITATLSIYATAYGDPIYTKSVTGSAAGISKAEDLATVQDRAVQNTAALLIDSLTPGFGVTAVTHVEKSGGHSHSASSSILLVLLTGLMVGLLATALHSSHGNGSTGTVSTGLPGGSQTTTSGSTSTTSGGSSGPPGPPTTVP